MQRAVNTQKLIIIALFVTSALVIVVGSVWSIKYLLASHAPKTAQTADMPLGGFPMAGNLAPDFTLTDQFNHPLMLSSLRGREVVLAFIDSRCKTLCPLTSNIMYSARAGLTPTEAKLVDLVAVNANPTATSVDSVQSWSIAHGMLNQWSFLTGTSQQLWAVYHEYNVYVQTSTNGDATHDPLTIIIDPQGHERLSFETLESNNKVDLKDEEEGMTIGMRQWLPHA